ncbi:MAG: hypothetical protein AAI978_00235 [Candidatus Hodgkinia cicadicola]
MLHTAVDFMASKLLSGFNTAYSVANNHNSANVPNTPVLESLITLSLDCLVYSALESAKSASPSSWMQPCNNLLITIYSIRSISVVLNASAVLAIAWTMATITNAGCKKSSTCLKL